MSQRPGVIYGIAFALSFVAFGISYFPFVWLLIRYQTWRLGHPNPFIIGPELDAIWCSLLAGVMVFWLVVKRGKQNRAR
jgi:hypothetical protein